MAVIKKEIKDFGLNPAPADNAQFLMQTNAGTTQKTTKSSILVDVNAAVVGLQSQIDDIDAVHLSTLSTISGDLQNQITGLVAISGDHETRISTNEDFIANIDLTFATDATLASISGNLQSQITSNDNQLTGLVAISGDHEQRILDLEDISDLDAKYVDVTGDTMTGNLTISGASLVLPNLITIEENVIQLDDDGNVISSELQELYVPVEEIVTSNSDGIKGQWSYGLGYYYKCIATNTWVKYAVIYDVTSNTTRLLQLEVDGDVTFTSLASISGNFFTTDANGKLIDSGMNVSTIASISGNLQTQISNNDTDITNLRTDVNTISGNLQTQISNNDTDITNLRTDVNTISGSLDTLDATYVNVSGDTMTGNLSISGAELVLPDLITVDENVAQVDSNGFVITSALQELYVPPEEITGKNATGVKGQWSFALGYKYECIATNTWIKYAVITDF